MTNAKKIESKKSVKNNDKLKSLFYDVKKNPLKKIDKKLNSEILDFLILSTSKSEIVDKYQLLLNDLKIDSIIKYTDSIFVINFTLNKNKFFSVNFTNDISIKDIENYFRKNHITFSQKN